MLRSHDQNGPSPKVHAWGPRNPESHHLLWASLPPVISSQGTFDHRLGEAWNCNGPTHPPQHLGAFHHLLFLSPSPSPPFIKPSLHHTLAGLLQPVLYLALLLVDGCETTYVPSLRFCSTTPASGISSRSHTRMTSHKRRGVCRYAIIVSAAHSHNRL